MKLSKLIENLVTIWGSTGDADISEIVIKGMGDGLTADHNLINGEMRIYSRMENIVELTTSERKVLTGECTQPDKPKSPWISVDKPPATEEIGESDILVKRVTGRVHVGFYDKDENRFFTQSGAFHIKNATEWMEIPK